ncbi:MAG: PadR family transcriptional regulator [Nakamurella sp.]
MANGNLQGHLELLVLAILADAPRHGYAVIEELRRRSDGAFDLPEGTVYPALHRLEKAGEIASEWGVVGGRRRKTYQLGPVGRRALVGRRAHWNAFAGAVSRTIGESPWPNPA